MFDSHLKKNSGIALIEVVLASFIVLTAAVCLYQSYYYGMNFIERQAHRRQALSVANTKMEEWRMKVSFQAILDVPRYPIRTVIDPRDPDDQTDDLEGFIEYGPITEMMESINETPISDYYKFWVRVYWYENNDQNDREHVQLVSYFTRNQRMSE